VDTTGRGGAKCSVRGSPHELNRHLANSDFDVCVYGSVHILFEAAAQQQAASSAPPAAPASPPAQPASPPPSIVTGKPAGPLASEKHTLTISNYAQAAVTATLSGVWVGQWDAHTSVPLDSAVQGRNELKIDLAQPPSNEVRVEVDTERGGQKVNLLRLNFQGKPAGSFPYSFAAR
jgi:hypothetical protein